MLTDNEKVILLVEDESLIALHEMKLVQGFGYEVVMVNSGEKAITTIQQNERINLVLMDIDLGKGLDGKNTSLEILKIRDIPIVFLTSHSEKEYVESVKGISKYGFVIKNSGEFVLKSAIDMAYELYDSYYNIKLQEEYLNRTLQSIGDAVIVTDNQGKIIKMNPIAERLTGWTLTEAMNKPVSEILVLVNEKNRNSVPNPIEIVLRENQIVELSNHTILISKDQKEYFISDTAAPIQNQNNELIGSVLTFSDITEKHKLIEATHRNQKLEAIGLLASGIAHDFNNLLGGIYGYIDLALSETKDYNTYDYLSSAKDTIDRAKGLTQQLLTFAKGGDPVRKAENINTLLKNTVHFALSGTGVAVDFEVQEPLHNCLIDKNQMAQVLDNLVINAIQAMNGRGVLTVKARNIVLDINEISELLPGDYVQIELKDTGPGIDLDIIDKIFDPFFTTKENGHGLGLSTCYSIVIKHRGRIEVKSQPGSGTSFIIYLPTTQESSIAITQSCRISQSKGTIIILEDEDFFHTLYEKMLNKLGFEVIMTHEGKETLEILKNLNPEDKGVSAVITDLTIPGGFGGKDIIAEIRQNYPMLPVFAASGYSNDPIISNPEVYGFNASLAKPFGFDELSDFLSLNLNLNDQGNK